MFSLLLFTMTSCELFTTRNPEAPDKNKSTFIPPTSPSIVVSNFISSIIEKNSSNYISCLADTTQNDKYPFNFRPTGDAATLYASIFQSWSLASERNYFNKLITATAIDVKPELTFENSRFDILLPDSALFVADYNLKINHDIAYINKEFRGTMQLIIFPRNNGLWSIKNWTDLKFVNDSIPSWSFLKGQLSN